MGSPATPLIHHLPITEARRNLGGLVRRLHKKGEYFVLVKDGIPVAALMDPDELDDYLGPCKIPVSGRRSRRANRMPNTAKAETVMLSSRSSGTNTPQLAAGVEDDAGVCRPSHRGV